MTYHQASWLINVNRYIIGHFYAGKYVSDLIIVPVNLNQKNTIHQQQTDFLNNFEEMEFGVAVILEHENILLKDAGKKILIPFFDFFRSEKILKD